MIPGRNAGNKLPEMQTEEWYGGNLSSAYREITNEVETS